MSIRHIVFVAAIAGLATSANAAPKNERFRATYQPPVERVYPPVNVEQWRIENRTLPPAPTMADRVLFDMIQSRASE